MFRERIKSMKRCEKIERGEGEKIYDGMREEEGREIWKTMGSNVPVQ